MHLHRSLGIVALATLTWVVACGSTSEQGASDPSNGDDGGAASPPPAASSLGDAAAPSGDGGSTDNCVPPDILITLDRTMTMLRTPAGQLTPNTPTDLATGTKFGMAISAIKTFIAPPRDTTMRFGLELWPQRDPGCVTMGTALSNIGSTNPSCEVPEILVSPGLGTANQVSSSLDPQTTPLCFSTPTGTALQGAKSELDTLKAAGKSQYVVLITDGADWDLTCALPDPLQVVDTLAADGISTVIVGFSAETTVTGGVGAGFLNDMACAGRTAIGFPASCTKMPDGTYRATGSGPNVFFSAQDQAQLQSELDGLAKTVCCGCVR